MRDDRWIKVPLPPALRYARVPRHAPKPVPEKAIRDARIVQRGFEGHLVEMRQPASRLAADVRDHFDLVRRHQFDEVVQLNRAVSRRIQLHAADSISCSTS